MSTESTNQCINYPNIICSEYEKCIAEIYKQINEKGTLEFIVFVCPKVKN
jgi:hypothetical protein